MLNLLWAPVLNSASQQALFWVICDVRPNPIDSMPEMAIRALYYLWGGHCGLKRPQNFHECSVE